MQHIYRAAAIVICCVACGYSLPRSSAEEKQSPTASPAESKTNNQVSDKKSEQAVEEAFAKFTKAAQADDWKTVLATMTDQWREGVVAESVMGMQMGMFGDNAQKLGFEAADKDKLQKIVAESQADPSPNTIEICHKIAGLVKDQPALITNLCQLIAKEKAKDQMLNDFKKAELKNLKVDGDDATGRMIWPVNDAEKKEPGSCSISFRRIEGKWFVSAWQ